jgi:RHS repeat-associated protein
MDMPGRNYPPTGAVGQYRYGFNGKEEDKWNGDHGAYADFGDRMYDERLGRWMSTDAHKGSYPSLSPYSYVANSPICLIDKNGKDIYFYDANNNLIALIKVANGKDIAYRVKNYVIDANSFEGANVIDINDVYPGYKHYPNAFGIGVSGGVTATYGVQGGVEDVFFMKGPNMFDEHAYVYLGGSSGLYIGGGPYFIIAWYNGADSEADWQSYTGWFTSYEIATPVGGAAYFYGVKDGKYMSNAIAGENDVTWWGVAISPPTGIPSYPKYGGKIASNYYWGDGPVADIANKVVDVIGVKAATEFIYQIEEINIDDVKKLNANRQTNINVGQLKIINTSSQKSQSSNESGNNNCNDGGCGNDCSEECNE